MLACGFHPLYDDDDSTQVDSSDRQIAVNLGRVAISRIPERSGQILRQALLMRMTPRGSLAKPTHRLDVDLSVSKGTLIQAPDGSISRQSVKAQASFRLTRIQDDYLEFKDSERLESSFESSPKIVTIYAEKIRERSVKRLLLEQLANNIVRQLAIHFANPSVIRTRQNTDERK